MPLIVPCTAALALSRRFFPPAGPRRHLGAPPPFCGGPGRAAVPALSPPASSSLSFLHQPRPAGAAEALARVLGGCHGCPKTGVAHGCGRIRVASCCILLWGSGCKAAPCWHPRSRADVKVSTFVPKRVAEALTYCPSALIANVSTAVVPDFLMDPINRRSAFRSQPILSAINPSLETLISLTPGMSPKKAELIFIGLV